MTIDRRAFMAALAAQGSFLPALGGAQESTIRVGALNPVSGSGSPYGTSMQKMIIAAAEEVNKAGGAAGRRIEIVGEDSQSNPSAAVLAAKKLIEVNKVRAILGTWSSGVSLAVLPLCNEAGTPLFHTSGAPALSTPAANARGLGFRFEASNDRTGMAFAQACAREGFKRPATMAFNNASGISIVDGFRKAWTKGGGEVLASVVYEPNQATYRSELSKVLASKPDVIVTGSYLADTTILLREWYQSGATLRWMLPGWAVSPELIRAVGPAVSEGQFVLASIANETSSAYKRYSEAYRSVFNTAPPLHAFPAETWDMLIVFALAVEANGGADGPGLQKQIFEVTRGNGVPVTSFAEGKAALRAGRKINYEGASSNLDFDTAGDVTPDFSVGVIERGEVKRKYVVKP